MNKWKQFSEMVTLLRIKVVGAPGVDVDGRRGNSIVDVNEGFFVECSLEEGVDSDEEEEELAGVQAKGRLLDSAPLVSVMSKQQTVSFL
jgi:hypothetical protein